MTDIDPHRDQAASITWSIDAPHDDLSAAWNAALIWRETFGRGEHQPTPDDACVLSVTTPEGATTTIDLSEPQYAYLFAPRPDEESFWDQIDRQLDRIAAEKPDTFDAVRKILLDLQYAQIQREMHRNFYRRLSTDEAFFAGSGGRSILEVLEEIGWRRTVHRASYYCVLTHERTGEQLTYIEGDLERGDRITD